jgi:hypothetical protein
MPPGVVARLSARRSERHIAPRTSSTRVARRRVSGRSHRAKQERRTGLAPPLLVVPSERLAGTAGDARIRGRAGAESRKRIPKRDGLCHACRTS